MTQVTLLGVDVVVSNGTNSMIVNTADLANLIRQLQEALAEHEQR
jgi:hypothetical protein